MLSVFAFLISVLVSCMIVDKQGLHRERETTRERDLKVYNRRRYPRAAADPLPSCRPSSACTAPSSSTSSPSRFHPSCLPSSLPSFLPSSLPSPLPPLLPTADDRVWSIVYTYTPQHDNSAQVDRKITPPRGVILRSKYTQEHGHGAQVHTV